MISTLYLFQFIAFYIWQLTSSQAKRKQATRYLALIPKNKTGSRWIAGVLLLILSLLFAAKLGLMSGICAFFVGLMGVGCLSVALSPFPYMRFSAIVILYIIALGLETFV